MPKRTLPCHDGHVGDNSDDWTTPLEAEGAASAQGGAADARGQPPRARNLSSASETPLQTPFQRMLGCLRFAHEHEVADLRRRCAALALEVRELKGAPADAEAHLERLEPQELVLLPDGAGVIDMGVMFNGLDEAELKPMIPVGSSRRTSQFTVKSRGLEDYNMPMDSMDNGPRKRISYVSKVERPRLLENVEPSRVLRITIVSAFGLMDTDSFLGQGASDPYVICEIVGKPRSKVETPVVFDNCNPVWNFAAEMPGWEEGDNLCFTIYDKDPAFKSDDFLGMVDVASKDFFPKGYEGTLTLGPRAGVNEVVSGKLTVRITFDDDDWSALQNKLAHHRSVAKQRLKEMKARETSQMRPKSRNEGERVATTLTLHSTAEGNPTSGDQQADTNILRRFVWDPASPSRACWDAVSVGFVGYDFFMIPFLLAFEDDEVHSSIALIVLSCATCLFWIVDMIMCFFVGFYQGGLVEMRLKCILKRYLQSWFCLDAGLVFMDIFFITVSIMAAAAPGKELKALRVIRSMRALRSLRTISLLRTVKLSRVMDSIMESAPTELFRTIVGVCTSLLFILAINHLFCCSWYFLGSLPLRYTWIDTYSKKTSGWDQGVSYRYLTSFHWGLTQFTPASMDVQPSNSHERVFTLAVDLAGLVGFSTFVSSITTRMTMLRNYHKEQSKQHSDLRRYFRQNKVSLEVMRCVLDFAHRKSSLPRRKHVRDIPVLNDVPEKLRARLSTEVYMPVLSAHPFFGLMSNMDLLLASNICHTAISEHTLYNGQQLFAKRQLATGAYFALSGDMVYKRVGKSIAFGAGQWIAEPALWMEDWCHRGILMGRRTSELIGLHGECFRHVLQEWPENSSFSLLCSSYASRFLEDCGGDAESEERGWLAWSDVWSNPQAITRIIQDAMLEERISLPGTELIRQPWRSHLDFLDGQFGF